MVLYGDGRPGVAVLLWTPIAKYFGIKILQYWGVMEEQWMIKEPGATQSNPEAKDKMYDNIQATPDSKIESPNNPLIKICEKCGAQITGGDKFCYKCGTKVANEVQKVQMGNEPVAVKLKNEGTSENKQETIVSVNGDSVQRNMINVSDAGELKLLFNRVYKSYISIDNEESKLFQQLYGTEVLGKAYRAECKRNKAALDNGIIISRDQSYIEFMEVLHDIYWDGNEENGSYEARSARAKHGITDRKNHKKQASKRCKRCGQPVDPMTKKCIGCGKSYSKKPLIAVLCLLVPIISIIGHFSANYYLAVSSMGNSEFISAQQYFDNLFIGEEIFPEKSKYIKAGVLMEKGEYVESLKLFESIDDIPVPVSIFDSLKSEIYSKGRLDYRNGYVAEAVRCFTALDGYERSEDYLLLLDCRNSSLTATRNYNKLVQLIGFEDASELILKFEPTAELFLEGYWTEGIGKENYFEMYKNSDGRLSCRYSLPCKSLSGTYFFLMGCILLVRKNFLQPNTLNLR